MITSSSSLFCHHDNPPNNHQHIHKHNHCHHDCYAQVKYFNSAVSNNLNVLTPICKVIFHDDAMCNVDEVDRKRCYLMWTSYFPAKNVSKN